MQRSLENFLGTRGRRRALAAVQALLRGRGAPRLLLLHGPAGVGKTHLLRAAVIAAGAAGRATTVEEIVREIVAENPPGWQGGLLVIDDLHTLAGKPVSQREVGRYLEERVRAGARVLAAAGSLIGLDELIGRLDRTAGAKVVALRPPGPGEMARLLVLLAARSGIHLDPATVGVLATRCRGDVRLAEGAVARMRLLESIRG